MLHGRRRIPNQPRALLTPISLLGIHQLLLEHLSVELQRHATDIHRPQLAWAGLCCRLYLLPRNRQSVLQLEPVSAQRQRGSRANTGTAISISVIASPSPPRTPFPARRATRRCSKAGRSTASSRCKAANPGRHLTPATTSVEPPNLRIVGTSIGSPANFKSGGQDSQFRFVPAVIPNGCFLAVRRSVYHLSESRPLAAAWNQCLASCERDARDDRSR